MLQGIEPGFLTLVIAAGMVVGMVYYLLTWRNCGGVVTPGVLAALALLAPSVLIKVALASALTFVVMQPILRRVFLSLANTMGLYIAVGLLANYLLEYLFARALPHINVVALLGFISPGLIAYYMRREGIVNTVVGTMGTAAITLAIALLCVQITPKG